MLVEFLLQFRCRTRVSLWLTDLRFTIEKFAAVPSPRVPNRQIFPSDQSATCLDKRRGTEQGKSCDATRKCVDYINWIFEILFVLKSELGNEILSIDDDCIVGCKKYLIIISFYIFKGISLDQHWFMIHIVIINLI